MIRENIKCCLDIVESACAAASAWMALASPSPRSQRVIWAAAQLVLVECVISDIKGHVWGSAKKSTAKTWKVYIRT